MKILRYIVASLMVLLATDAMAWRAEINRAVLLFAEENLSNRAKREVESLLNAPLSSLEFENKGMNKTRLNEDGKSVTTDEKDAVVMLEKAIATLEDKGATAEARRRALHTVAETTVDIHCLANILIDKHLEKDFTFGRHNSMQIGFRYYAVKRMNWQELWHKEYHRTHGGVFSAEMYLYDMKIATAGMAKHYKRQPVAPRRWAEQTGEQALRLLKLIYPDALVEMSEVSNMEDINDASMYAAGFHLANLLNKTLK